MLFPLLAPRVLARNVAATPWLGWLRNPSYQITRSFSVSGVACAPAAASATRKASAKRTATKKRPTKKAVKKSAAKKKAKPKAKKAKNTVKKVTLPHNPELRPPKRPGNAYTTFCAKFFSEHPPPEGIPLLQANTSIMRDAGAAWKTLSEQEKQPFRDEAAAALEAYNKRMEEYLKNTDSAILREINRRRKKAGRRLLPIRVGSYSGYTFYTVEQLALRPKSGSMAQTREYAKEMGRSWHALSDEEKQKYRTMAQDKNASLRASQ